MAKKIRMSEEDILNVPGVRAGTAKDVEKASPGWLTHQAEEIAQDVDRQIVEELINVHKLGEDFSMGCRVKDSCIICDEPPSKGCVHVKKAGYVKPNIDTIREPTFSAVSFVPAHLVFDVNVMLKPRLETIKLNLVISDDDEEEDDSCNSETKSPGPAKPPAPPASKSEKSSK